MEDRSGYCRSNRRRARLVRFLHAMLVASTRRGRDDFTVAPARTPNATAPMKIDIYLNYPGHCLEAFRFYEAHLGGRITMVMTHGQGPNAATLPPEQRDAILHARMELGGTVIMGADIPHCEPMRSAYLTLSSDSEQEAERVYALLSEGGQIFMKMEKTFFANRFAMLRDRFGTSWMLLHEIPAAP